MQSSVVKLGAWGGAGGSPCDLTVAPRRLESITICYGMVIDWISFSYRDRSGKPHAVGPWGRTGKGVGTETITLEPSEYVTGVAWSVGPLKLENVHVERCITSMEFVSNLRSYGPFGHGFDSAHHTLPVLDGGSVVGMFARAGEYLEAIGFYVLPPSDAALPIPAIKPSQEEKGKDSSQEEKEEEKSNQDEKESQEEKENGKS